MTNEDHSSDDFIKSYSVPRAIDSLLGEFTQPTSRPDAHLRHQPSPPGSSRSISPPPMQPSGAGPSQLVPKPLLKAKQLDRFVSAESLVDVENKLERLQLERSKAKKRSPLSQPQSCEDLTTLVALGAPLRRSSASEGNFMLRRSSLSSDAMSANP